jgi:hypothetical protein
MHTIHRRAMLALLLPMLLLMSALPATPHAHAQDASAESLFAHHYWLHHGATTLGRVHSPVFDVDGTQVQYFEKGRLEDHRHLTANPAEAVGHTPLVHYLIDVVPDMAVDGMPVTYGALRSQYGSPQPVPEGFTGGTMFTAQGVFVPADYALGPVPGYVVPFQMWMYINRVSLFPGGWMHGVGLPLTSAFTVAVPTAGGEKQLIVQAFDKAVLVLDADEYYNWSVRRANIGTDAAWVYGMQPAFADMPPAPANLLSGPKRIEVSIDRQWLYAYQGDVLVLDMPVSTGKDGFNTPRINGLGIYLKHRSQTLRGNQGGESWYQPDVPGVMYYQRDIAIHGVYWHNRFGTGERHSHGCVGVAPHDALYLFDWAPVGTRVIVR